MNFDYIRSFYSVPACIGRRVTIDGKPGVIAADRGNYIGVNFDCDKPNLIKNAHPTWEVVYGEMGKVRPMTRSQKRYLAFLEVGDLYEGFSDYLRRENGRRWA